MCGIVGYVGSRPAVPVIVEGLRRLEYRGYDSAGVAVVCNGDLLRRRSVGKLRNLEQSLEAEPLDGAFGIGHTRWATHGRPSEENAHPHMDCRGKIVVVHNGIIENYLALKQRLTAEGHKFVTQTDTEVVAHLVESLYAGNLEKTVREAVRHLEGIYALVILHKDEPQKLVGARMGPPLVVGLGEGEHFLASDIPALLSYTKDFLFLEDGELAVLTPSTYHITDAKGEEKRREPQRIAWDPVQAEKGGYRHFMLKEIHEQPRAVRDTLLGRIGLEEGEVHLEDLGAAEKELRRAKRVVLLACGTSWHAALVGKYMLEQVAKVPAEVDWTRTRSASRSARAARPRTPWPPSARPRSWAPCPSRSAMSRARSSPARPRAPSSPTRARRSGSPPPRPSRPRSWPSPSWPSTSAASRGRWTRIAAGRSWRAWPRCPRSWRTRSR
jgi:glucosamine--fructose-6-phosphate aminotransferase (isomerizing)